MRRLGSIFPRKGPAREISQRLFPVLQLEVTGRCRTGCRFCPIGMEEVSSIPGDLSYEVFQRDILPWLHLFEMVYLQGWGEPLLHENFWEMLEDTQRAGCKVGFTTNGSRLNSSSINRIIDAQADILSVSFAGATAETHESLRRNSRFSSLVYRVQELIGAKNTSEHRKPWVELHFLMMKKNIAELPAFVELAASLGADEVVATNLTYAATIQMDQAHVFGRDEEEVADAQSAVDAAITAARHLGIPFRAYPLLMNESTLVCDSDPIGSMFITHTGEVAPCVYMGLNIPGEMPRYFLGEEHKTRAYTFGNVSQGLDSVINGDRRAGFVDGFRKRKACASPLRSFSLLFDTAISGDDPREAPPPPEPCRHCYKMYGV